MSQPVDELFGAGGGAPRPNFTLVFGLLAGGLVVSVLGLGCTILPGVGLVMLAWQRIEKEMARVENGFLPQDERPAVLRLRNAIRAVVLAMVILAFIQFALVQMGLYDALLLQALDIVPWPFGSAAPSGAPPAGAPPPSPAPPGTP